MALTENRGSMCVNWPAVLGLRLNVVPIREWRCTETIAVLEQLLRLAQDGQIKGLAVCAKHHNERERIAFTGDYRSTPALGVNAANRMSLRLTQLQDERDAEATES
jgi:hypothetical protein